MFKRTDHERLTELKQLINLYGIAIGQQENRIDSARRGKLTFTQISEKVLFGLLNGDLNRLKDGLAQTTADIQSLEEALNRANEEQPEKLQDTDTKEVQPAEALDQPEQQEQSERTEIEEQEESSCFLAEVAQEVQSNNNDNQEEGFGEVLLSNREDSEKSNHSNEGLEKERDNRENPICFDTNGIETPDITNDNLLDTLRVLDGIDGDGNFKPLFL